MNKRKILTLALTLCMVAILAIGGTLAYFSDAENKTNVMTIGSIDIDLEEYKYVDGEKVEYTDSESNIYPIADDKGIKLNNKIVEVYNDSASKDDAYIRVIVAFEDDVLPESETLGYSPRHISYLQANYADLGIYGVAPEYYDDVVINGDEYDVVVFNTVDGKAIPYGQKVQALQGVWLDSRLTTEDMKDFTDKGMNIRVLAQGIQTYGFNNYEEAMASFGEINEENLAKWFNGSYNAVINDHDSHTTTNG